MLGVGILWVGFMAASAIKNYRCDYFQSIDVPNFTIPHPDIASGVGKIFSALHTSEGIVLPNNSSRCYYWKCKSKEFRGNDCSYCLPSVFVAGFSKCGTTALCSKLGLHPEIKPYRKKEINIFTKFFDDFSWDNFEKRVYDPNPERTATVYLDCTASAFRDFNALAFLMKYSPDTRFIFAVRDPFQRLASWLLMFKRAASTEKYDRFYRVWMSALKKSQYLDSERYDPSIIDRLMTKERYISSFLYAEVLLHWRSGISPEQIFVYDHYELEEHPLELMRRIESYLSLTPHSYDASELLSASVNTGTVPEDDDGHLGAGSDHKKRGQVIKRTLLSEGQADDESSDVGNITRSQPIHAPYQITDKKLRQLFRHLIGPSLCLFERIFGWPIHIVTESELSAKERGAAEARSVQ